MRMTTLLHLQRKLRRKIWRERRRAAVCGAMLLLSQIVLALAVDPARLLTPTPYLQGAVTMLLLLTFASASALVLRGGMFWIEVLAVLHLLGAVYAFHDPAFRLIDLSAMSGQPWRLPATLAAFILADLIYAGRVLPLPTIRNPGVRYAATSPLSQQALWDGLVGTPPHKHTLADRDDIITFEALNPGQPHRRMLLRDTEISTEERHQMVTLYDPPHRIGFDWSVVTDAPSSGFDAGSYDLHITDAGHHRRVEVTDRVARYPAHALVRLWINDTLGRELDAKLETLEQRADGPAPGASSTRSVPG